jgi:hypothetical protein
MSKNKRARSLKPRLASKNRSKAGLEPANPPASYLIGFA